MLKQWVTWFCKTLPVPNTDYIAVTKHSAVVSEDTAVDFIELYTPKKFVYT